MGLNQNNRFQQFVERSSATHKRLRVAYQEIQPSPIKVIQVPIGPGGMNKSRRRNDRASKGVFSRGRLVVYEA
jgi:hypothetical protein